MAEPMIIPPWMSREYADPATTFLNAFKTGAAISQAQKKMAMDAHQNQVSTQIQREKIQQDALQSQAQLAASQAYREMTNKMAQAQLEETKRQHLVTGLQAAATLAETQARNREMDEYRQRQATVDEQRLAFEQQKAAQPKSLNASGIIYERDPETGEWVAKTERPEKELTATTDPLTQGLKVSGPLSAMQAYQKEQEAAAKAEAEKKAQAQPPKSSFWDSPWSPFWNKKAPAQATTSPSTGEILNVPSYPLQEEDTSTNTIQSETSQGHWEPSANHLEPFVHGRKWVGAGRPSSQYLQKGDEYKGYRFQGGDPSDKSNWEKVESE